jgi:hypothetical protein
MVLELNNSSYNVMLSESVEENEMFKHISVHHIPANYVMDELINFLF